MKQLLVLFFESLETILKIAAPLYLLIRGAVPREKQEEISRIVVAKAEWIASYSWQSWLNRAARFLIGQIRALYGPAYSGGRSGWRRYASRTAFRFSLSLASWYLLLGVPIALGWQILTAKSPQTEGSGKILGLIFLIAVLLGLMLSRKFQRQIDQGSKASDKFLGILICLLCTITAPLLLIALAGHFFDAIAKFPTLKIPFASVIVLTIAFIFYKGIQYLARAFNEWLPLGILFCYILSFPLGVASLNLSSTLGSSSQFGFIPFTGWSMINAIALSGFFIRAFFLTRKTRLRTIWTIVCAVLICTELSWTVFQNPNFLTMTLGRSGISFYKMYFSFGAFMASVGSLVYANAIADFCSVSITRTLLLNAVVGRSWINHLKLIAADAGFALALTALAYLIFAFFTHGFISISGLPLDDFLEGLRSLPEAIASQDFRTGGSTDFLFIFGQSVGKTALIFGATACLPTILHAGTIACWCAVRLTMSVLAIPAGILERRLREARISGEKTHLSFMNEAPLAIVCIMLSTLLVIGWALLTVLL